MYGEITVFLVKMCNNGLDILLHKKRKGFVKTLKHIDLCSSIIIQKRHFLPTFW